MTCRQTWKVEAVRDGQLAAHDSQAIASHLQVCMHCADESERLVRIGDAVRQIPIREPSALAVRIQRRKLLEEATAQAAPTPSRAQAGWRRQAQPIAFALAAAAALVLVLTGIRHKSWRSTGTALQAPTDATMASSEVEVRATPESRWSQTSEPAVQLIALEQGALWTKITHNRPHPPVVFRVPDGQIEDVGTTFTVAVRGGQTQRVAVEEGTVLVHLRGVNEMRLTAGQTWERKNEGAAQVPAPTPSPAEVVAAPTDSAPIAPAQVEAPAATPAPATVAPDAASKARARAASKAVHKSPVEESRLLKKGTAALHAGRYTEAVSLFERFAADFPQSGRAEDAAYLHALSLARAGRFDDALVAAREYLSRFPNGFRRTEMQDFVERSKH